MESKTTTVCVFVLLLGIAAAIAGFVAEATKVKTSQVTVVRYGYELECEYPSSPAMGLAIAAVVALVIARVIITSATGGCCSCCQSVPNLSKLARLCIVISWVTSTIAVILFLAGAKLSGRKGVGIDINGGYYCYTVKPGVFMGAGIMGFVSVLLKLVYYINYVSAINGAPESGLEQELEAPPIADGKKPPIADGKKPPIVDDKKPPMPSPKH